MPTNTVVRCDTASRHNIINADYVHIIWQIDCRSRKLFNLLNHICVFNPSNLFIGIECAEEEKKKDDENIDKQTPLIE